MLVVTEKMPSLVTSNASPRQQQERDRELFQGGTNARGQGRMSTLIPLNCDDDCDFCQGPETD
jgi:hypothetical protein